MLLPSLLLLQSHLQGVLYPCTSELLLPPLTTIPQVLLCPLHSDILFHFVVVHLVQAFGLSIFTALFSDESVVPSSAAKVELQRRLLW